MWWSLQTASGPKHHAVTALNHRHQPAAAAQQRFRVADGRILVRDMGFAIVHVAGISLPDLVVFAEPNDATLIGVHTIEGLNLKIDVMKKELVDAGPIITASAA